MVDGCERKRGRATGGTNARDKPKGRKDRERDKAGRDCNLVSALTKKKPRETKKKKAKKKAYCDQFEPSRITGKTRCSRYGRQNRYKRGKGGKEILCRKRRGDTRQRPQRGFVKRRH